MIKTKDIRGKFAYQEARNQQTKKWRSPTIFELLKICKESEQEEGWFWSASPYAYSSDGAWVVAFGSGNAYGDYKSDRHRLRLVRKGQDFDFCRPVTLEEVDLFKETGMLPDWHPPLEKRC